MTRDTGRLFDEVARAAATVVKRSSTCICQEKWAIILSLNVVVGILLQGKLLFHRLLTFFT